MTGSSGGSLELQAQRARLRDPNRQRLLGPDGQARVPCSPAMTTAPRKRSRKTTATASASANFPVSMEAAKAARARGMQVIAGAPNIVRGGSHSGNVSAADLVRAGAVDALASDYVPASLVEAAFACVGPRPASRCRRASR